MTRKRVFGLAVVCLGLLAAGPARAATWKTNVNYGATTAMDLYVPDRPATSPAIVVSLHYCGGNAGNAHGWFQSYADQYGFIIIAPKSAGSCFDAGLGRTGERANIVKMVQYVVMQNNADPKKVYAAGPSSGACMTQALLASYPDVFAGGSSLAGVPAGAWTGGGAYGWSAPASTTAQQWGDKVRNADPGFTGGRPRVQFWQGMGDTNLTYSQTYPAQLAQWTNVFGVTDANATKENIKPPGANNTWARTSYKDCNGLVVVEANSGPSNVVHDLTPEGLWQDVVRFFGLAQGGTPVGSCGGAGGAGGGAGGTGGGAGGSGGGTGGASGRGGAGGSGATGGGAGTGAMAGRGGSSGTAGAAGTVGTGGSTGAAGTAGSGGVGGPGTGGSTGSAGTTGAAGTTGVAGAVGNGGRGGAAGSGASGGAGTTGAAGMVGSGNGGSSMDAGGGCEVAGRAGHSRFALATLFVAVMMLALRSRKRTRR
jgi:poly(hydroxyalkanoate) depolymerase family esterase